MLRVWNYKLKLLTGTEQLVGIEYNEGNRANSESCWLHTSMPKIWYMVPIVCFKVFLPVQKVILFERPEKYEERKSCFKITQRPISSVCHESYHINIKHSSSLDSLMSHKFKKKAPYSATLPWLSIIILQTSFVHLLNQELQKNPIYIHETSICLTISSMAHVFECLFWI